MRKLLIALIMFLGLLPVANSEVPANSINPKNMEDIRSFVDRAEARLSEARLLQFTQEIRVEGDWKHDTTYLIVLETDGYPFIHAYDRTVEDRDISSQEPVMQALDNPGECFEYEDHEGVSGRYACSIELTAAELFGRSSGTDTKRNFLLIGGLHTAPKPEEPFEELLGSGYVPEVTAGDVKNAETLKLFVDGALEAVLNNFGVSREEAPNITRFRPLMRREGGPWNQGDIYIYVMRRNQVVFNGNSQSLEGTNLDITDKNGCNVGDEIHRVIRGEDRECVSLGLLPENPEGYLEYLWDNPDVEGDEDERFKESQEFSPGFTPKLGYVKSFTVPSDVLLIVGSGVYPVVEDKSNGGCALASGSSGETAGLLSLLLIGLVFLGIKELRKNKK